MAIYEKRCGHCGEVFRAKRASTQKEPRFCSYVCYWASGGPAKNSPYHGRTEPPKKGRRSVYLGRVDGKPRYMLRSRWVWNQAYPDDPAGPSDHIHHVDGDTLNDDPANLVKFAATEHAQMHAGRIQFPERSRRMAAYHAANPGRQRKGAPKTCPICSREFYRSPSAKAITCSYTCMGKLRSMGTRMCEGVGLPPTP